MTAAAHRQNAVQDQGAEYLSVRVGEQEFAMDIMAVREIKGWTASTPMPHAPAYVRGMINLRGVVLAIIDLADRLGLETRDPTASSVVVVVEVGDHIVGLLVDAVCDVVTVTQDQIQSTPDMDTGRASEVVQGLFMQDDRIIGILSIPAVVPSGTPKHTLAA